MKSFRDAYIFGTGCICTDDTSMILGSHSDKRINRSRTICKIKKPINGQLLMPYVYEDHWRLLVVDAEKETLTLLDRYGTESDIDRVSEALQNFI